MTPSRRRAQRRRWKRRSRRSKSNKRRNKRRSRRKVEENTGVEGEDVRDDVTPKPTNILPQTILKLQNLLTSEGSDQTDGRRWTKKWIRQHLKRKSNGPKIASAQWKELQETIRTVIRPSHWIHHQNSNKNSHQNSHQNSHFPSSIIHHPSSTILHS